MSQQSILLELPDELYKRVQQIAETSNRPLESVLVDSLALLFGESTPELTREALPKMSDEQLWAVVYRHLAWQDDARLRELTALSKSGQLKPDEQSELEHLIDKVDGYILLRSQALLLLKQRGHAVEQHLKTDI